MRSTRLAGAALAVAVIAGGSAAAAWSMGAPAGSPTAGTSQFKQEAWSCHPKKFDAYGRSNRHMRFTLGEGGVRFYTIKYNGSAIRCRGKTRIQYNLSLNTKGFPRNRFVTYFLQSAGVNKKWRTACVRLFDSNEQRCDFKQEAGEETPRAGQRAIYQFRGRGTIRYLRLVHVARQRMGRNTTLVSKQQNVVIRLSRYFKRPKSLW